MILEKTIIIYIFNNDKVGLIDRLRIDREIIKLELDHHKITSKLKNENFVSKAPPAVVSAEQERLAEIDNVIVTLRRKCELLRQKN